MKFIILSLMLTLVGCSGMSLEECQTANWGQHGENAARAGRANSFNEWTEKCSEHGVAVDSAAYDSGYKKGLVSFCTYQGGYDHGDKGLENPKICPPSSSDNFLKGYLEGKNSFDKKAEIEKQAKLVEDNQNRDLLYKERVLGTLQRLTCKTNSDCVLKENCLSNRCSKSARTCSYQSDCSIQGSCNNNVCAF